MKKSFLIILGLAALAGVLTLGLLSGIVAPKTAVVAKYDLAAGTRLTAELLEERRLPAAAVPDGAFKSIEEAAGLVLTTSRISGDVITSYVAGDSQAAAGIPAELAPGTVAIAVKIDQATGLAGIVRPGQRVAVIAILDPQAIQQRASYSSFAAVNALPTLAVPCVGEACLVTPTPAPTATPTPTPAPPLSPAASITITGLRVLVVPQSFRYEELPASAGEDELFAEARTSQASQEGSVILLEAPVAPVTIAPGYAVSPAALLALLNEVAVIHLVLEPAEGLSITTSVPPVDLAELYEAITGYDLNAP